MEVVKVVNGGTRPETEMSEGLRWLVRELWWEDVLARLRSGPMQRPDGAEAAGATTASVEERRAA